MNVGITGVAYSPIEYGLVNADQWQKTAGEDTLEDLDIFKEYITEVIVKNDQSNVTRGRFVEDDTPSEECLNTIKNCDFETENEEFCDAALTLANRLNDNIHHTANEGVLFSVQAEISGDILIDDGGTIALILKLDLEKEERVKLREDNSLESVNFEDLFPKPDELQKALMYPVVRTENFRLPGDIKFYQKDTVSEYFHNFVDCEIDLATLEQAKGVFEAISEIKRDRTGRRADASDLNRFRELREESDAGVVEIDQISEAASDIVGDEVTGQDIADRLGRDNPEGIVMDSNNLPSQVKYEVDDEITVKFPSTAEERVQVEEGENNVHIEIIGGDLTIVPRDR